MNDGVPLMSRHIPHLESGSPTPQTAQRMFCWPCSGAHKVHTYRFLRRFTFPPR